MIEVEIVGGCGKEKEGRPCRQGSLDNQGIELITTGEQLQDGSIDLEEDPSALVEVVLEKAMNGGGSYTCAYCDSKVNIVVDAGAYMSLMDAVSPGEGDPAPQGNPSFGDPIGEDPPGFDGLPADGGGPVSGDSPSDEELMEEGFLGGYEPDDDPSDNGDDPEWPIDSGSEESDDSDDDLPPHLQNLDHI